MIASTTIIWTTCLFPPPIYKKVVVVSTIISIILLLREKQPSSSLLHNFFETIYIVAVAVAVVFFFFILFLSSPSFCSITATSNIIIITIFILNMLSEFPVSPSLVKLGSPSLPGSSLSVGGLSVAVHLYSWTRVLLVSQKQYWNRRSTSLWYRYVLAVQGQ